LDETYARNEHEGSKKLPQLGLGNGTGKMLAKLTPAHARPERAFRPTKAVAQPCFEFRIPRALQNRFIRFVSASNQAVSKNKELAN
jgi:hypothetical protein